MEAGNSLFRRVQVVFIELRVLYSWSISPLAPHNPVVPLGRSAFWYFILFLFILFSLIFLIFLYFRYSA